MFIKRLSTLPITKPIKVNKVVYAWCSDGYCYDMTNRIKRRFWFEGEKFLLQEESYSEKTVVPFPQHIEAVQVSLVSEKPRIWIEKGEDFEEAFEEVNN